METSLANKVVIVTGAGRGIGRAVALAAAGAGARVVVSDNGASIEGAGPDPDVANGVVADIRQAGGEAIAALESVTDRAGARRIVEAALDAWGAVHGLVCCAAITRHKPFMELTEEDFEDVLDVHLKGHFLMYQETLRAMIASGEGGSLVGISSGYLLGDPNRAAYRSAKAGIVALTKSVAHVAAEHGVRANLVAPIANTRLTRAAQLQFDSDPEDISPMVVYLLSDLAAGINGEIFSVLGNTISSWEDPVERRTARHHSRWDQPAIDAVLPWLRSGTQPLPPVPPLPKERGDEN